MTNTFQKALLASFFNRMALFGRRSPFTKEELKERDAFLQHKCKTSTTGDVSNYDTPIPPEYERLIRQALTRKEEVCK